MKISKRLLTIASFIDDEDFVIYDVGCDHALLDIYLADIYKKNKFYAIDISEKCIENAKISIKNYGFEKRIIAKVNNGLNGLILADNSTLVISGMGTHSIIEILNDCDILKFKKIVIQSNNDLELLRRSVVKKGFKINSEKTIYDKKYYVIIEFVQGKGKYTSTEYIFGPNLILNVNKNKKYFEYLFKKYKEIYERIPVLNLKRKISILIFLMKIERLLRR